MERKKAGLWKRAFLALLLLAWMILESIWYRQHLRAEFLWGGIGAMLIIGPLIAEGLISPRIWVPIKAIAGVIGLTLLVWLSMWPMAPPQTRWMLLLIYLLAVLFQMYKFVGDVKAMKS